MTNETIPTKYEINPGEWVDIEAAFDRHTALTDRRGLFELELHPGVIYERVASAKTGGVKNVYTPIGFTLKVSGTNISTLIKILNAAPVNGDPLQAIVNLELDSTAGTWTRERIARYLADVGANPTLENCAAGYLYEVGENEPLKIDVAAGEYKEYAVTSVISKSDSTKSWLSRDSGTGLSSVTFEVPDNPVTVVSENSSINLEDLEGVIIANGGYRIIRALEPGGKSPLGGFILERIEEGDD